MREIGCMLRITVANQRRHRAKYFMAMNFNRRISITHAE
jgi:hypothetical protein